ncbi:MAG: hypothetical protein ABFQ89_05520 [Chloroflexota bacterium]
MAESGVFGVAESGVFGVAESGVFGVAKSLASRKALHSGVLSAQTPFEL